MTTWEKTCLPLQVKEHWCKTDNVLASVFKLFQWKMVLSQQNILWTHFRVDSESWMSVMGSMKCKVSNKASCTQAHLLEQCLIFFKSSINWWDLTGVYPGAGL